MHAGASIVRITVHRDRHPGTCGRGRELTAPVFTINAHHLDGGDTDIRRSTSDTAELVRVMRAYHAAMVSARIDELDTLADKDYALVHVTGVTQPKSDWFDVIRRALQLPQLRRFKKTRSRRRCRTTRTGGVSSTPRYMG